MLRKLTAAWERRNEARLWAYMADLLDEGEVPALTAPAAFVLPDATWTGVAYVTDRAFLANYNAGHRGATRVRIRFDSVLLMDRRDLEVGLALDDGRLVVVALSPSPTTAAFVELLDRELG